MKNLYYRALLTLFATILSLNSLLAGTPGPPPPPGGPGGGGGGGGTRPEGAASPIDMYVVLLAIFALGLIYYYGRKRQATLS